MVLYTLEKSFGQCRGFHDLPGDLLEKQYTTEFVNIVSATDDQWLHND
jgi:hypothetical protein